LVVGWSCRIGVVVVVLIVGWQNPVFIWNRQVDFFFRFHIVSDPSSSSSAARLLVASSAERSDNGKINKFNDPNWRQGPVNGCQE
jgi:hypothetical protein